MWDKIAIHLIKLSTLWEEIAIHLANVSALRDKSMILDTKFSALSDKMVSHLTKCLGNMRQNFDSRHKNFDTVIQNCDLSQTETFNFFGTVKKLVSQSDEFGQSWS